MDNEVTALLQAYGIALAAIFATHPHSERLREAFERMAIESPHPHHAYQRALQTFRNAIPER